MEKKQKVWLVSEVFFPDIEIATGNIATEIALKLAENFEVHVLCGPKNYEKRPNAGNLPNLDAILTIHRVNFFNFDKNKPALRFLRVLGISFGIFILGFKIRKADKAFVISNPAFITPFFAFLRMFKGFEYNLLMHDVFPENLVAAGFFDKDNILYRILFRFFVYSRKFADRIIVIGRDMKAIICDNLPPSWHSKVEIIPNWADIENVYPIEYDSNAVFQNLNLNHKIIIQFAGNHGILQNLLPFIEIVRKLSNENLHFVFAGEGATKSKLVEFSTLNNMQNVTFLPAFSRHDLNSVQNACNIGLVSLSDSVYGIGVPSKSYNILSAGKPILFLGKSNSEIAAMVKENDIGWAFEYSQEVEILNFLNSLKLEDLANIELKGKKGRRFVVDELSKCSILNKISAVVSSVS